MARKLRSGRELARRGQVLPAQVGVVELDQYRESGPVELWQPKTTNLNKTVWAFIVIGLGLFLGFVFGFGTIG